MSWGKISSCFQNPRGPALKALPGRRLDVPASKCTGIASCVTRRCAHGVRLPDILRRSEGQRRNKGAQQLVSPGDGRSGWFCVFPSQNEDGLAGGKNDHFGKQYPSPRLHDICKNNGCSSRGLQGAGPYAIKELPSFSAPFPQRQQEQDGGTSRRADVLTSFLGDTAAPPLATCLKAVSTDRGSQTRPREDWRVEPAVLGPNARRLPPAGAAGQALGRAGPRSALAQAWQECVSGRPAGALEREDGSKQGICTLSAKLCPGSRSEEQCGAVDLGLAGQGVTSAPSFPLLPLLPICTEHTAKSLWGDIPSFYPEPRLAHLHCEHLRMEFNFFFVFL